MLSYTSKQKLLKEKLLESLRLHRILSVKQIPWGNPTQWESYLFLFVDADKCGSSGFTDVFCEHVGGALPLLYLYVFAKKKSRTDFCAESCPGVELTRGFVFIAWMSSLPSAQCSFIIRWKSVGKLTLGSKSILNKWPMCDDMTRCLAYKHTKQKWFLCLETFWHEVKLLHFVCFSIKKKRWAVTEGQT